MIPPIVLGPSSRICVPFLGMTSFPYNDESFAPETLPPSNLVPDVNAAVFNIDAVVCVSCRLVISCDEAAIAARYIGEEAKAEHRVRAVI